MEAIHWTDFHAVGVNTADAAFCNNVSHECDLGGLKNTGAILNPTTLGSERLTVLALADTAACATVQRDELALFNVELFVVYHFPFVETARAQRFAFVLFAGFRFFKGKDVGHGGMFVNTNAFTDQYQRFRSPGASEWEFYAPDIWTADRGTGCASKSVCASGEAISTGRTTVNTDPCPGELSTKISPPNNVQRCLLIARPRPVPPKRRVVELSACMKD